MSLHSYHRSLIIADADEPFYALIMAAMRKADDTNLAHLRAAWPEVFEELKARHWSPNGLLPGENLPTREDS